MSNYSCYLIVEKIENVKTNVEHSRSIFFFGRESRNINRESRNVSIWGRSNNILRNVGRDGLEGRKKSELVRTKSNTFCCVEKVETYQYLVGKVKTHQNISLLEKIET